MADSSAATAFAESLDRVRPHTRLIALLALGHLVIDLNQGAIPAVLPFLRTAHGWSYAQAGTIVLVGNLLGSVFVAYFFAVQTGVITADAPFARISAIAEMKGHTETDWQVFLRGIGCNWLVCLAIWMSIGAQDIGGKILAIFFPVMAFVAMGFDHLVANMFFLPAAIFAGVDGITWADALSNWLFAGLGNVVGAVLFVAGAYWYLHGHEPQVEFTATLAEPARVADRTTRVSERARDGYHEPHAVQGPQGDH